MRITLSCRQKPFNGSTNDTMKSFEMSVEENRFEISHEETNIIRGGFSGVQLGFSWMYTLSLKYCLSDIFYLDIWKSMFSVFALQTQKSQTNVQTKCNNKKLHRLFKLVAEYVCNKARYCVLKVLFTNSCENSHKMVET